MLLFPQFVSQTLIEVVGCVIVRKDILSKDSSIIAWVHSYIKDLAVGLLKSVQSVDVEAVWHVIADYIIVCYSFKTQLQEATIPKPNRRRVSFKIKHPCSILDSKDEVFLVYIQTIQIMAALKDSSTLHKYLTGCLCAHVQTSVHEVCSSLQDEGLCSSESPAVWCQTCVIGTRILPRGRTCEVPSHLSTLGFMVFFMFHQHTWKSIDLSHNDFSSRDSEGSCLERGSFTCQGFSSKLAPWIQTADGSMLSNLL